MKKIVHLKGITGTPLCDGKEPKSGFLFADKREECTCEKCLNYGWHNGQRSSKATKGHRSKSGTVLNRFYSG